MHSVHKKYSWLISIFLIVFFSQIISAQQLSAEFYAPKDLTVFFDYTSIYGKDKTKGIGSLVVETGKYFLGKPYVAGTLEVGNSEQLIVNLSEFDCTTFVETCLALSRTIKNESFDSKNPNEENFRLFAQELEKIRYRDGKINGYPSRLHYFSDWIQNNQKKGVVTDVTASIGGVAYSINIGFMSANPDKYKQLSNNPDFIADIAKAERRVNYSDLYYIPKYKIEAIKKQIQTGDIIAFTTNIQGLDVSHVGLAVWQKGELYLLHASLSAKKVIVSTQPLVAYTQGVKNHTGIMVARPNDIKNN